MAATWPNILNGTTITFKGGDAATIISKLVDVSWDNISRAVIDLSSADTTGAKTFAFSPKYDPGALTVTMLFDPSMGSDPTHIEEAIVAAKETGVVVTFSEAGGDTWTADAGMTDFSVTASDETRWEATAVLKFSGEIATAIAA